ncbi:hypothetical protein CPB86DRAFT_401231 [Serendipita vermifera]|nr:hypothetical protein CPB86DRAFT_401231 [Serendipita vermifera]
MSYSDPLIAIERELAKHPVQTFKIYFSKPHSVSVHPQARDLDKSHVGDLVISFTKGIDRSSAQPMLAILQSAGNSYVSAHQNIDPQKLPILLISGQHRMRALQRLSWDRRYHAEAWWTVKVYDADLETDLGSAFRLLMVRENLCTPLVSKPATTGDLFSAYQKIVKDTKFLEYLKESKRKPGIKKKDQSPETLLSTFTRAFMTCYDDQVSYPLLEELMKNEIFRQCLHIDNYRAMTIHRLPHLASSIVKQIIEFWELSGYLEGDPSKHPKALLDKVATIRCPTLEKAQSWMECNINWEAINEGPQSSKLQLYGTPVKWIFGQRLPIPNILGSGYIQEMMAGAGKLVDAVIYCLHPSEDVAFKHLEIRELFLSELKGEDRSKVPPSFPIWYLLTNLVQFEHAALRFSQLLNVPSRFRTVYAHGTLGDSVSALLTRPEWYDFMEQCPHQSARNWLSDHPRPLRSQAIAPPHVDNVDLIRRAQAKKTTIGLEVKDSDSESDLTTLSSSDDESMEEESPHNAVTMSSLRPDSPSSLEPEGYPNLPDDKDNDPPEHIAHSEEDRPEDLRPQVCSQGIQTEVPSRTNEIVNTLLKLGETRFPLLHDLLVGLLEVKDERWKDTISQMRDHLTVCSTVHCQLNSAC